MATKRAPFITKPLSGYYHREVPKEDEYLTHTGPGTPAGEYLRRFWQPVAYTFQLTDLPLRVEIMGEDLVVFRDGRGEIGLLELHCSHRGTSLEFGLIEERGIRCCYHGWLFDTVGRILDTPLEPPDSTLKDRLCHGAYPVKEYSGIVFAYMGPPDKMPEFPIFDLFEQPGYTLEQAEIPGLDSSKPCNWLQIVDNFLDPLHEEFLHARMSGIQFLDKDNQPLEELAILGQGEFYETPTGIITLDIRRVDDCVWVRNIEYVRPNIIVLGETPAFPPKFGPGQTEIHEFPHQVSWAVPANDTKTLRFSFVRTPVGQPNPYNTDPFPAAFTGRGGRSYEDQQRTPGDYEAQVSQRDIARHSLEHLGVEDKGVTMYRRDMRKAIRMVEQGQDPPGIVQEPGKVIATYAGDTVLKVPPAPTEGEDQKVVLKAGRDLAKRHLKNPPHLQVG